MTTRKLSKTNLRSDAVRPDAVAEDLGFSAKRRPIRLMRDEKLLFEINRRVLHPLGYALAIEVPDPGSKKTAGRFYLLETDDPEGYYMGELDTEDAAGLLLQEKRRLSYLRAREALGYPGGVEPLP